VAYPRSRMRSKSSPPLASSSTRWIAFLSSKTSYSLMHRVAPTTSPAPTRFITLISRSRSSKSNISWLRSSDLIATSFFVSLWVAIRAVANDPLPVSASVRGGRERSGKRNQTTDGILIEALSMNSGGQGPHDPRALPIWYFSFTSPWWVWASFRSAAFVVPSAAAGAAAASEVWGLGAVPVAACSFGAGAFAVGCATVPPGVLWPHPIVRRSSHPKKASRAASTGINAEWDVGCSGPGYTPLDCGFCGHARGSRASPSPFDG